MTAKLVWDNLVAYSLQIGLLVALAAFVPAVLRLRLPGAKLAYWHFLLAACLLLPVFSPRARELAASNVQVSTTVAVLAPAQPAPRPAIPRTELALGLLAAGALLRLGWLAAGFWRLRQYRRHSRPLESATGPATSWSVEADLRISDAVASPVTFGFRKPVVLLPARFPELNAALQEAILCHEGLHVRRRDWLFTLAEEVVRAVFWFHPAIWWLLGEIGLAREQAVDREVIALTHQREEYLDALLAIAGAGPQLDLAPAPLFLRKRHLKQRVVSILKEVRMSKARLISALTAGLGILAVACWFVTSTFPLTAAPQAPDGAGVTVDLGGAAVMHRGPVIYPEAARKQGVEGTVTLELTTDANGNVSDARVLSGPVPLRRSALQSVLQWHLMKNMSLDIRQVSISYQLPVRNENQASPAPQPAIQIQPALANPKWDGTNTPGSAPAVAPVPRPDPASRKWMSAPLTSPQKLAHINIVGLPDQARADLLSQLPLHEGDTLSRDSLARAVQVVHEFDEHLNVNIITATNGDANMQITAPGAAVVGGIIGGVPGGVGLGMGVGVGGGVGGVIGGGVIGGVPGVVASADYKRITIGGNVQQAKLIYQPKPAYPPEAKAARIEGVVHLQAVIATDGTVIDLTVLSGHPLLVPAALEAVKQWVYQQTLLNGEPVEIQTRIDVNFTLSQ
ncbi:MAG TPA: M56 family metallopeptidase [Candidatus Acidoferrales bacterium]|nr:M56 family metallopeptidase [Candidatus Acidoferrales bacterium]